MKTLTRPFARLLVISEANAQIQRTARSTRVLSARHINEAVAICRHNQLVGADILAAAGFNATKR